MQVQSNCKNRIRQHGNAVKVCRKCGCTLNNDNWYASRQTARDYICNPCYQVRYSVWKKNNPDKAKNIKVYGKRYFYEHGGQPMSKNKECPLFLGVHVAERVLRHVFKDVKQMQYGNPGYDFICNHGKKVDVKSACLKQNGKNLGMWTFIINRNKMADYFLCLAFDNRENLTPMHLWLIPAAKLNGLRATGISISTIHKWDAYKLDIHQVEDCCNKL